MTDDPRTHREKLLEDALRQSKATRGTRAVALDVLLKLMKERSCSPGTAFLSSLYFAGAFDDHPYFLHNREVAIGLAVLPEDRAKAGQSKRHPHQKEILVVIAGRLLVELEGEPLTEKRAGDVVVIEPGRCHRVIPVENEDAAYLFVKTRPGDEPREEECSLGNP